MNPHIKNTHGRNPYQHRACFENESVRDAHGEARTRALSPALKQHPIEKWSAAKQADMKLIAAVYCERRLAKTNPFVMGMGVHQ